MKVHIEVDMTPEEARTMMGLPDVAPLQQRMMEEMQARMKAALTSPWSAILSPNAASVGSMRAMRSGVRPLCARKPRA